MHTTHMEPDMKYEAYIQFQVKLPLKSHVNTATENICYSHDQYQGSCFYKNPYKARKMRLPHPYKTFDEQFKQSQNARIYLNRQET